MIDAITNRRAVRAYLTDVVKEEVIKDIALAAFYAPSANGLYPWELVVVEEPATKDLLSRVTPWSTHAKDAAAIIAVIGHEDDSKDWVEDCAICAEHMWLAATSHGLGACWIQIRGNDTAEKSVKEILHIPNGLRVLCLLSVGVPAEPIEPHQADEYDKNKVKWERYK